MPYDRPRYEELAVEVRRDGLNRGWVGRARPHTVNCYRKDAGAAEPVLLKDRTPANDWFLYLFDHYDPNVGLCIPKELEYLGA